MCPLPESAPSAGFVLSKLHLALKDPLMADQEIQDTSATPVFQIQRVYLKDMSLEQPNSPGILLEQEQPSVDIQLSVEATPVADGIFEVAVTATVHTKIQDKTVFLVEAKQAGIFEIRNIPEDQMGPVRKLHCLQALFIECIQCMPLQRAGP